TAEKIQELRRRTVEGPEALAEIAREKQGARGKKAARDRIEALLDDGSFVELDAFTMHRSTNIGLEKRKSAVDDVITENGTIKDGSVVDLYEFAMHRTTNFGHDKRKIAGDVVITGYSTIDGRQVCIYTQDFSVFGGSL